MSETSWPIVGHEWAVELLHQALVTGRMPHALLISGPPQVGKMTLARALAAAINCTGAAPPCGNCRACRLVFRDAHPDVRVIQAEDGKDGREGILKIDQIRELQRGAALAPVEGRRRVFLLREMERANLPAANALLKTLEEPPPQVILLLTSARPYALLPTIVSRCQFLPLRTLPVAQVVEALVARWGAAPQEAMLLARLCGGRIGWAVQRLTGKVSWERWSRRLADARELSEQDSVQRLAYAEALYRQPESVLPTLWLWTSWWRDLLLTQHGCFAFVSNVDRSAELQTSAGRFTPTQVRDFLARLESAPQQWNQNASPRLLLENLLLHYPVPSEPR